jgi:ribosomal RNA-processing protein 9
VTGGADNRIIVWNQTDLKPLRVFTQHRDAVTSLAFRRGTNQLYSASADRTIKIWSLNELAYVETLFGHQDQIVDVATLAQERCLSAGARDRTIRLWKVVDETQLIFRGGGSIDKKLRDKSKSTDTETGGYAEGSIDRVAMIDDETFVSGSDNGSLSLWSVHRKKPVCIVPLAHGCEPPLKDEELNMDDRGVTAPPEPRWITALAVVPYSDLVLSGSWDGQVRAWKVSEDKKKLEAVGILGRDLEGEASNGLQPSDIGEGSERELEPCARGVVNDIDVFGRGKDGVCVVVALGKEHRLGRWMKVKGKNGAMMFEIPRYTLDPK